MHFYLPLCLVAYDNLFDDVDVDLGESVAGAAKVPLSLFLIYTTTISSMLSRLGTTSFRFPVP